MFKKLTVEDFAVLRGPLESGRQSPENFGGIFIIAIFLQALLVYLEYYIKQYSIYPNIERIFEIHFWVTVALVVLSVLYSIPFIYMRSQKMQYLLSILISQNTFCVPVFLLAIIFLGTKESGIKVNENSLQTFTQVTLLFGLLIIMVTWVRFYILLQKGQYRKGSKKDELRSKFETTSYLPLVIIGGIGIVFVIQYLLRNASYSMETDIMQTFIMIVLPILIFFVMLFVLPEQLVILYCKFRFKSFNFNQDGELFSEVEDMGRKLKDGI